MKNNIHLFSRTAQSIKPDVLEKVGKSFPNVTFKLAAMKTLGREDVSEAHPGTRVWIRMPFPAVPGDLLRKSHGQES